MLPSRPARITTFRLTLVLALSVATATVLFGQAAASDSVGRRRIQPLPALGSAPETGMQFGVTTLAVWEPAAIRQTRPAMLLASALRTTKSQTRLRVEGEHWSTGNARRLAGSLQWQEFPLPYFGVGDRTPDIDDALYTPRGTEAALSVQQRVRGPVYAMLGIRHLEQRITTDTGSALQQALVRGARGGTTTEFTVGVQLDTRDNLFAPHAGQWVQLTHARSDDAIWSDFSYRTTRLDARSYHDIGASQVIAVQLQATGVEGGAPFDALALVGNGDIMRGYKRGRYRDRWMTAAQGEYRSAFWHRVGAVAFAGAGVVAPTVDALADGRLLPTYGAGLRVQLDARQRTGIRADYGRGLDDASGLYIGFNQAF